VPAWRLLALRVRTAGRLTAGPGVCVARNARVRAVRGARVHLGAGAVLGPDARIEALGGRVVLGRGARLDERAVIRATASVVIGDGAVVGPWALVDDTAPTWTDPETPVRRQPPRRAPVRMGPRARLGPHAVVLAGVELGPGEEVAPYAVRGDDAPATTARDPSAA
jgi:acetyltransferase-like isoleucine patch superfamily enzyme